MVTEPACKKKKGGMQISMEVVKYNGGMKDSSNPFHLLKFKN